MAVKRWNGTAWEVYAGADLAPVKVTDGRPGKTTFIGATSPTGQVDGDIWIDQDTTTNAVVPTALTTKGDTFVATGNAAYTRLAAGNNGESLFVDSSTNTGLRWQGNHVAGKNLAINGAFDFWQRGTSFSNPFGYTADRFAFANAGSLTYTISRQAFTAGDEPSASIAGQYYLQNATTAVVSPSITDWYHRIEDVSMLSGKTITISFYGRATIGTATLQLVASQYNGTSYVDTAVNEYPTFVAGNGWRRYSTTVTLPTVSRSSISGSSHHTNIILRHHHSVTTFGIWGFQVELGSVATPFSRAGGDLEGELAKCQRYYEKSYSQGTNPGSAVFAGISGNASGADSTGYAACVTTFKVTKRTPPSIVVYDTSGNINRVTSFRNDGTNTANKTGTVDPVSDTAFRIYETGTLKNGLFYHYVADAEL